MKPASSAMSAHLAQGQTTLCALWKVTRKDSVVIGFTSTDEDIVLGGVTYLAATGFVNTATSSKSDFSVDNLEVAGFLDSESITEDDLRAAVYDSSEVEIRVVNWNDPSLWSVLIRKGTIGIVKMVNGVFTAEIRGLTNKLTTLLGASLGPICRATFGSGLNGIDMDSQYLCMIDVTLYRQTGSVASVTNPSELHLTAGLLMIGSATPTSAAPNDWFNDGVITFTSGNNNGLSFEVKTWTAAGVLTFYLPLPRTCAPGDTFTIEPGCNKTTGDCTNKFDNIINNRSEPFIPGMNRFLNVVGAGSGLG
jgi:uncharacterized phage protein (TIGR02218 family)